MSFFFELSGEHDSLPKAELLACLEAVGSNFRIEEEDHGVLTIDTTELGIEEMKGRLALTHYIDQQLYSCDAEELTALSRTFTIGDGSFAVRAKRIQRWHEQLDLKTVEIQVAAHIKGRNKVDLLEPDNEIRVIISGRCHIGVKLAKIDRSSFETRKAQFRPYFSPVSLHPRLARVLVNLSRVKKGGTLLDPFCGTGGVLIETSLIAASPIGSDIDKRMVAGCRENLKGFDRGDAELFCADISEVGNIVKEVDAIATDPPYGRAATTNREELYSLYTRAFETFAEVLKSGGYVSIALPEEGLMGIGKNFLSLKECYAMKVHRSLTRHFCVYRKE